jgi:sensor histidine kinase YesM
MVNDKEEKKIANDFGGIGLSNIRKRLDLIYPDNHELKIEDLGDRFYVSMIINLQ